MNVTKMAKHFNDTQSAIESLLSSQCNSLYDERGSIQQQVVRPSMGICLQGVSSSSIRPV